jgi:hypothetical protein
MEVTRSDPTSEENVSVEHKLYDTLLSTTLVVSNVLYLRLLKIISVAETYASTHTLNLQDSKSS